MNNTLPGLAPIMNSMNKKSTAVLYHYPCTDGAFAALAAHLYFSATSLPTLFFPNTVYNPLRVEQLPLHQIDEVYLLDFVGPPGFVQELSPKVSSCLPIEAALQIHDASPTLYLVRVIVLDHHKTALENLSCESSFGQNVTKIIDIQRSGATIAYDYFKQKLLKDASGNSSDVGSGHHRVLSEFKRIRRLFDYIEDGDLWRWSLPNSKALSSGLKDLNIEYDTQSNPSLFHQLLSLDIETIIGQGMVSLSHKQKLIDDALNQSHIIELGGGAFGCCLAVDADSISELRSELGHQLATKSQNLNLRGIGAVVYRVPALGNDQMLKISLRSVDSEDTTPISQEFGGGGHRNASSFMLCSATFENWKV